MVFTNNVAGYGTLGDREKEAHITVSGKGLPEKRILFCF